MDAAGCDSCLRLKCELQEATSERDACRALLAKTRREVAEAKQQAHQAEAIADQHRKEAQRERERGDVVEGRLRSLLEEREEADADGPRQALIELQGAHHTLECELAQLESKYHEALRRNEELLTERDMATEGQEELEAALSKAQHQLDETTAERDKLRNLLDEAEVSQKSLRAELGVLLEGRAKLESLVEDLRTSLDGAAIEAGQRWEEERRELRAELERAKERVERQGAVGEEVQCCLEEATGKLAKVQGELDSEIEEAGKGEEGLRRALERAEAELRVLQQRMEQAADAEKRAAEGEEEVRQLRRQLEDERAETHNTHQLLREEVERMASELKKVTAASEADRVQYTADVEVLRETARQSEASLREKVASLETAVAAFEEEESRRRRAVEEKEKRKEELCKFGVIPDHSTLPACEVVALIKGTLTSCEGIAAEMHKGTGKLGDDRTDYQNEAVFALCLLGELSDMMAYVEDIGRGVRTGPTELTLRERQSILAAHAKLLKSVPSTVSRVKEVVGRFRLALLSAGRQGPLTAPAPVGRQGQVLPIQPEPKRRSSTRSFPSDDEDYFGGLGFPLAPAEQRRELRLGSL
eukprot:Sspe_Gene.66544::Locus_39306_Transcript_1_1_Confidence_1.000_Length_1976::g.66544::m.66544